MHCEKPPCADVCPEGAISKREDGIVLLDEDLCTGCQVCIPECPYGALVIDDGKDLVRKCSLCNHRVGQDLEPFCVICCETEAMVFGDLNDPDSVVSQMISKRNASTLDPEKGTGPCIYYCPTRQGRIT
jgi:Fe-S-cluster-containing dehydrogenase component